MRTLSFRDLKVGRSGGSVLLDIDSERDGVRLRPGLQLIVAPNGFGKTTFLQTVAGVLPAISGELRLDDQKLDPESEVLYVSEYLSFPKFIYPSEWIEFVAPLGKTKDLQEWVTGFSLDQKMKSFLGRMSQGERRKVTWLAAHASSKPVILMDEPLDGLDLLAIPCARKMIAQWKNEGRIVFIVAHQVGELLDLADEVFLIRDRSLRPWSKAMRQGYQQSAPESFREEVLEFYRQEGQKEA